jgi:chaperone protein DnaK
MTEPVIGIDLGTTNSCVAYQNSMGEVQILQNDLGHRTTPSYVTFLPDERLVGQASKAIAVSNLENTVFDAKRLIGRKFSDKETQDDIARMTYRVVNEQNQPMISVAGKSYRPEEVSSVVLGYLKTVAEKAIGQPVKNAVITVPAYFNDSQRQATKDAGTLAGLNVLRIINEPTAAAMAYGITSGSATQKLILVFDLGGGTFDVSLLQASSSMFKVLATAGDTHLGGEDFDNILTEFLMQEYQRVTGANISTDMRAQAKIRRAAEQAKCALSATKETMVDLSHIGQASCDVRLSRAKFNSLCGALFKKCLEPVDKVLADARRKPSEVDEIVMVGGSSRIPKVQELLQEYFSGKKLNMTINPDEAVAYGAAVHGASITGQENCHDILLVDVAPLSLGVETQGGIMDVLIPRQKTIPCKVTKKYRTASDNQTSVTIKVFEGERSMTCDNNKLGEFELSGIPPAPKHMMEVEVTFKLDTNGILSINATELSTGQARDITITGNSGHMSQEELEQKVKEAEECRKQDEEARNRVKERSDAEEYLEGVLDSTEKIRNLTEEEKGILFKVYEEGGEWLRKEGATSSYKDILAKRKEWEEKVIAVYKSANSRSVQYVKTAEEPANPHTEE